MIDVKELKENHPEFALLLENYSNRPPHFSNLNYRRIPVQDLQVDSYILVRAGEVREHNILYMKLLKTT
jgi:Zn2+/Cd2+-exporting ATPase